MSKKNDDTIRFKNTDPYIRIFNLIDTALGIADNRYYENEENVFKKHKTKVDPSHLKEYHQDYVKAIETIKSNFMPLAKELEQQYIKDVDKFAREAERLIINIENSFHVDSNEMESFKQDIRKRWWDDVPSSRPAELKLKEAKNFIENKGKALSPDELRFLYLHYLDMLHEHVLGYIDELKGELLDHSKYLKSWLTVQGENVSQFKENTFNNVPANEVYKYFKKNLVDRKFLVEEDLNNFLYNAFEKKEIPQNKISFIKTRKVEMSKVFYSFYNITSGKPHGEKTKYAALLGEYFTGFTTEQVLNNFRD